MKEIHQSRFRPVLVAIFWCWLLLSTPEWKVAPSDSVIFPEIVAIILLLSLLVFKIKEKISITSNYLILDLCKNSTKINLHTIQGIDFEDCFNILNIVTSDTHMSINIAQFDSRKVEKLFSESGLYKTK
ncbi:hypothetical protein [uncultured Desulfuromonas sp.]|uniref:hypothetical protein n=1 Tax=uncultured Desulfuromonas sp. TaxID=181013 RepID=UPI002AAAE729|nr:hypothetical protein [uncultured Desulfuromonas sp.]